MHSIQYSLDTEDFEAWVTVQMDGSDVSDAAVEVEGTALTYESLITHDYVGDLPGTFIPGKTYHINVTVNGVVYSDSVVAPGGITISSDGMNVSWQQEGSGDWLAVAPASDPGSPTYDTYQGIGTTETYNINSPQTIPASAYAPGGAIYMLHVVVKQYQSGFSTAGGLSGITCNDISSIEYQK